METILCVECGEVVITVRRRTSKNSKVIKQKCGCTEASHDALAYEVDGWEWVSYDG